MRSPLHGAEGERLTLKDYYADFEKHFWHCGELGFWKLDTGGRSWNPAIAS